ncbi:MAG: ABC transporter ATP-binding protein [Beijerinckiaceae bacterium]
MARLNLAGVSKFFGAHAAVDDVSMEVADGEFVAVLGPSGCGKTTMLRLIAGFDNLTSGRIELGERVVSGDDVHMPPEKRRTGIVFQSYALWPHMTVAENVAYALKVQNVAQTEREARVRQALDTVGLTPFSDRRPALLSGGQRQRVALARCLAMRPDIVLLDEPLANLDAHLRAAMEEEFASFHRRAAATMVYITHDQAEAMALADRIAVMDRGRILQMATPSMLYREPADATVARFIGAGMLLPAQIASAPMAGQLVALIGGHRAVVRCRADAGSAGSAQICVRAHDLAFAADGLEARVERLIYRGGSYLAEATLIGDAPIQLRVETAEPAPVKPGETVRITVRDGWLVPPQMGAV